jgi:hypothetical protein
MGNGREKLTVSEHSGDERAVAARDELLFGLRLAKYR